MRKRKAPAVALVVVLLVAVPAGGAVDGPESVDHWAEAARAWMIEAASWLSSLGRVAAEDELGPMNDPDGAELGPWSDPNGVDSNVDPPEGELGPMNDPNG